MLDQFGGLLVGIILGGGEGLVGVRLGVGESLVGGGLGVGEGLVGSFLRGGGGLLVGGLHVITFLGGLADGGLLFFEGLLDGGELLGGFGLGVFDAGVGDLGQFLVAAREGLEDVLGILLGGGEGGLLGVELGFQFGHAFGGGLAVREATAGGGEIGLGLGDLGVRSGEGGGDFRLGGGHLLGEFVGGDDFSAGLEGDAALFEFGEREGGLGGGAGVAFGEGGLEGRFGFRDLGFGGGIGALGGFIAGVVEGLADGLELGLGSGFALSEGGLHLLGGFDHGGDVVLEGAGGFEGFAVRLLHQALEFGFIAFRDRSFAGGRQLGEGDVHLGGEAEIEGALIVRAEGRLQVGDFRGEAALAHGEFVVGVALQGDGRRRAAHRDAVQANRGARRVRGDRDRINERGVNGGRATSDAGAKNEEGYGETHGAGIGGRFSVENHTGFNP